MYAHHAVPWSSSFNSRDNYRSKVWGHLDIPLFLKEKQKKHQIDKKYSVDIINVVNDYCSWKWQI